MKTFSIANAAAEPFRLVGRRPLATIVWGLVMLGPGVMVFAAMAPLLAGIFSGGFDPAVFEPGTDAEEALFGGDMAAMMQFQLWSNLAQLLGLLALVVVTAAIIRGVFAGRKGDPAFFLRVGMAELQVAVVGLAVGIGFFFVTLIAVLLAAAVGFALWQLGDPWRWLLCIALGVAVVLGLMLLWGRLSLLAPASIRYKTFAFEEGWKLGRGQTWRLVGLWITLFLIAILVGVALMVLIMIVVLAVGGGVQLTDPEALEAWITGLPQRPAWMAALAVMLLIPVAWLHGFSQALFTAPFAQAVQALAESDAPQAVTEELH